ncbi:MAG: prepilin-type N-terminal cleavage/methylation domain-containing protein [Planctomycetota bacterium]
MKRRAFTLLELLVVMSIMIMLALMTLPIFMPLYRSRSLDGSIRSLEGVMMKARSLAATRNQPMYVTYNTLLSQKNLLLIYQGPPSDWNDNADLADEPVALQKGTRLLTVATEQYTESGGYLEDVNNDYRLYPGSAAHRQYLCFTPIGTVVRGGDYEDDQTYETISICMNNEEDTPMFWKVVHVLLLTGELYQF